MLIRGSTRRTLNAVIAAFSVRRVFRSSRSPVATLQNIQTV